MSEEILFNEKPGRPKKYKTDEERRSAVLKSKRDWLGKNKARSQEYSKQHYKKTHVNIKKKNDSNNEVNDIEKNVSTASSDVSISIITTSQILPNEEIQTINTSIPIRTEMSTINKSIGTTENIISNSLQVNPIVIVPPIGISVQKIIKVPPIGITIEPIITVPSICILKQINDPISKISSDCIISNEIQENLIEDRLKKIERTIKEKEKIVNKSVKKSNELKTLFKPKLILIRGSPGCGKTTYAKIIYPNYEYISSDDYFIVNGEYIFDPLKLGEAHKWCITKAIKLLKLNKNVVVTNNFKKIFEIENYEKKCGEISAIKILKITSQYKSNHNASNNKIEEYNREYESHPKEKSVYLDLKTKTSVNTNKKKSY